MIYRIPKKQVDSPRMIRNSKDRDTQCFSGFQGAMFQEGEDQEDRCLALLDNAEMFAIPALPKSRLQALRNRSGQHSICFIQTDDDPCDEKIAGYH